MLKEGVLTFSWLRPLTFLSEDLGNLLDCDAGTRMDVPVVFFGGD